MQDTAPSSVIVLIPAFQEGMRVAATVQAARALPGVPRVIVIDDGSTDDTATRAADAGAEVIVLPANGGKGAALRAGLTAAPGASDDILLLLDADLESTASEAAQLLMPLQTGEADLAIARFPRPAGKGGFGLVKGLARTGTWLFTRRWLAAPISGQRACRRWVLDCAPIADGYGVEVAMNIAAGDAGARIVEVPVTMTHAATGRTLAGFAHRGRQCWHILGALFSASLGRTGERIGPRVNLARAILWVCAVWIIGCITLVAAAFWRDDAAVSLESPFPGRWVPLAVSLAIFLGPLLAAKLSLLLRVRRKNYAGRYLPALGGVLVLPVSVYLLLAALPGAPAVVPATDIYPRLALPLLLLGWMLLGMLDDTLGATQQRKGFRGHLSALLHGQLTTGGIKMLGGGVLALAMAGVTVHGTPRGVTIPLAALLIALSANMLNLFDMRPGRALKVYWLCCLPLLPVYWDMHSSYASLLFFLPLLATLVYAPLDFAGMMMLGDTGANPLGAFVGYWLVVTLPPYGQGIAVLLLIALHLYAERVSITETIARVRGLRWLDNLGRTP